MQEFWNSILRFFKIEDGIHDYEQFVGASALVLVLLAIGYNLIQLTMAFLLVRRMNPESRRGSVLACLLTIAEILARHPFTVFRRHWNIFIRMRMRVEHEIFRPRPEWVWPPEEGAVRGSRVGAWWHCLGKFIGERAAWHWTMAQIANNQCIKVKTAGDLNDEFDAISRYFIVLDSTALVERPTLSFVCEVQVERGFVAPLHLLTGLLAQYNEKWNGIIDEFEMQTSNWRSIPLPDPPDDSGKLPAQDFRQLQSFIFHCWLLWGPSIPVCESKCENWTGGYLSLQYGFGDENNSIEIVGERNWLAGRMNQLIADSPVPQGVMAVPATVKGVLRFSSTTIVEGVKFTEVLRTSWKGGQDPRPVIFFSEEASSDAVTGVRAAGERIVGELGYDNKMDPSGGPVSRYYSAYLWIMFVVLRYDRRARKWVPLEADEEINPMRAREPWKGTIPFFEHGNIADAESCGFAKQVLADKVLGAMLQFVTGWPKGKFPLRFAYAGAIDDSHCGTGPLFPRLQGGETIRERIEARLKNLPEGSALQRISDETVVDWKHFTSAAHHHPHSTCSLPRDIRQYYKTIAGNDESEDETGKVDEDERVLTEKAADAAVQPAWENAKFRKQAAGSLPASKGDRAQKSVQPPPGS